MRSALPPPSAPAGRPTSRDEDLDDLDDLGPLDDDGDGEAETPADELDPLPDDAGEGLDDATGEDDPVGDEWLDPLAGEASTEGADADDALDVGDAGALGELDGGGWLEAGATDLPETPEEDPELEEGAATAGDAGEEGPLEEGEALREEDLPSLDADDGGEEDDAHFFDALADETPLPWSRDRWDPRPVASHLDLGPVRALAPIARGALALVKDRWVRIELDGAVIPVAAGGLPDASHVMSVASEGAATFVTTDRGSYRSDDGGESFAPSDAGPAESHRMVRAAAEASLHLPRGFEVVGAASNTASSWAVVHAHAQGRLYVVDLEAKTILAEVLEPDAEDGALPSVVDVTDLPRWAVTWDETRGLLWIGGPIGVVALEPRGPETGGGRSRG